LEIASWIANNILGQAPILVGLVAFTGLVAQRKPFTSVLQGTIKTITGFLMMTAGSSVIVGVLNNFLSPSIVAAFGLEAPAILPGMGEDVFLRDFGGIAALVMTFGFFVNLLLARTTPFKYVYLTGHLMWFAARIVTCCMLEINMEMSPLTIVLVGGVICGLYWTLQPAWIQKYMKNLTDQEDVSYGHTSSVPALLAAFFGKFVGKKEDSTERIKMPEGLNFFRDVTVATGLVMMLVSVAAALGAGPEFVAQYSGGKNYIVFAIMQSLTFAAGSSIMLSGVRIVLGEIVPAFRGISTRIVPNTKPALDCPIVFSYAPTAVLVGFLSSFTAFVILMLIFSVTGYAVIIPPLIMLFFPGGASAVFGNSTGGIKGAILGGVICGVMLAFGQAIGARMLGSTVPRLAMGADPDMHILIAAIKYIGQAFAR
jgi:PTS system ascorbate-specific IIC component